MSMYEFIAVLCTSIGVIMIIVSLIAQKVGKHHERF